MKKSFLARSRSNFLTGLAVVLPGVVSVVAIVWLFGTVANITDTLLFFLPRNLTHKNGGEGPMFWYWSLVAFTLAVSLICAVGVLTRHYIGVKMIEWVEAAMMRVPFLNKIYGATKQVNDALTSGDKNSFKTVVMIEFPHPGSYAVGFLTSEQQAEPQLKLNEKLLCVFVPTTPNPTSGFLMLVPEHKVTRLEMSVADGIKYIISLGAIAPEFPPR
ncbi:MAG TPA: DUF502 domain-containing protein [Candidatus Paceibacterota bacterium]|nr:DUF502 domain-containing protein [Candidatus Paceibacterota bacterium]